LTTTTRIALLLSLSAALAGCTPINWTHPTKTDADFKVDKFECEREAALMYPVQMQTQTYGGGYQAPSTTSCKEEGNKVDCTIKPGQYTPPPTSTVDVNSSMRFSAFKSCMQARGYIAQ
jgi:uncharacterized lipoprotein